MPTTPRGIEYPDQTGDTQLWLHYQNLAETTDAAIGAASGGSELRVTYVTGAAVMADSTTGVVTYTPDPPDTVSSWDLRMVAPVPIYVEGSSYGDGPRWMIPYLSKISSDNVITFYVTANGTPGNGSDWFRLAFTAWWMPVAALETDTADTADTAKESTS